MKQAFKISINIFNNNNKRLLIILVFLENIKFLNCKTQEKDSQDEDSQFQSSFFRRLHIPEESELSFLAQIIRPNVLPELTPPGLVMKNIITVPTWFDLKSLVDYIYDGESNEDESEEEDEGRSLKFKFNRCFLFKNIESLAEDYILLTKEMSHLCLLRAICEIQAFDSFLFESLSKMELGILYELTVLILSPSLEINAPCPKAYFVAENYGRKSGYCEKYEKCPLNFGKLFLNNFINPSDI